MTYEVELIGTVIGRDADDYEVEFYNDSDINTLRSYSFRESSNLVEMLKSIKL